MKLPNPLKLWFGLLAVVILLGGFYFALAKYQSWWPFDIEDSAQQPSETVSWQTFTSPLAYEVKHPAGWEILDLSYNYQDKTNLAFWIYGPWRSDIPGASNQARFAEQVSYDPEQDKFTGSEGNDSLNFVYAREPGDQAVRYVDVEKNYIKNSADYKTAQAIIQTAKVNTEISTPPVTEASVETAVLDCGTNFDCLVEASSDCRPAKVIRIITTDISGVGVEQTTTSYFEIQGGEVNTCSLFLRTEKIDLVFPPGADPAGVSEEKELYKKLEGRSGTCQFATTDLYALLLSWQQGDSSSDDFAQATCQGTIFQTSL